MIEVIEMVERLAQTIQEWCVDGLSCGGHVLFMAYLWPVYEQKYGTRGMDCCYYSITAT